MKSEAILTGLTKLYAKRKVLDKQIETAEKNLISAAKTEAKPVKGKKPANAKKTVAAKKPGKRGRKPKSAKA
jgi:hypothetical protein